MHITLCTAREIKDSRGRPTVEVELVGLPPLPFQGEGRGEGGLGEGPGIKLRATASAPSGKSTGSHEALELRDEDGVGVSRAVGNVQGEVAQFLAGREFASLQEVDDALIALDGTPGKSRLGANAILPVSIAAARLFARERGLPLWQYLAEEHGATPAAPRLFANVMNGGAHANFRLPFQEYMVVCAQETATKSFAALSELFADLRDVLVRECGTEVPMGDEGGYSPTFSDIQKPFEILSKLIEGKPGLSLAIDAAASELLAPGEKEIYQLLDKKYSRAELLALYETLVKTFPLASIEDPFAEGDEEGFHAITAQVVYPLTPALSPHGERAGVRGEAHLSLIVADDLTVTDPKRIEDAAGKQLANAVIIKPNQIGTVSEACAAAKTAREHGWKIIMSHRSGETDDTFIADLAYGLGAYGIKAGGLAQKERLEKYQRLLEIEKEKAAR